MFNVHSCGCITLGQSPQIIIYHCCNNQGENCFGINDKPNDKPSIPMEKEKEKELIEELGKLIQCGYRYRTIKYLLN